MSDAPVPVFERDVVPLTRRLLAEAGLPAGALTIGAADVQRLVARAMDVGGERLLAAAAGDRACRVCGCTQFRACRPPHGPCAWAADDLCTACEEFV